MTRSWSRHERSERKRKGKAEIEEQHKWRCLTKRTRQGCLLRTGQRVWSSVLWLNRVPSSRVWARDSSLLWPHRAYMRLLWRKKISSWISRLGHGSEWIESKTEDPICFIHLPPFWLNMLFFNNSTSGCFGGMAILVLNTIVLSSF